ncbi:MAG: hypothetical protein JW888_05335 [Pirellulales bacterium]|nr:hypothetical protein [Pirellulales bacterium]
MSSKRNKHHNSGGAGKSPASNQFGTPWPIVLAAASGLLAAWVAAGSTGLLVDPLRHGLVALLLGVMIVALRPSWRHLAAVATCVALGVVLSRLAGGWPVVDVSVVAAILATMAWATTGPRRRTLLIVAAAAAALAVFRAACFTVPTLWTTDQAIGTALGWLGGRSLWIGGSLGGLDLLIVMGVFHAGWLRATRPPRRARAVYAAVAILAVQAVYLAGLSHAVNLADRLPEIPRSEPADPGDYRPTDWHAAAELRGGLPWNLPLLATVLQAGLAMVMLRWTRIEPKEGITGAPLRYAPATQDSASSAQGSGSQGSGPDDQPGAPGQTPTTQADDGEDVATPIAGRLARFARWGLPATILLVVATGLLSAWPPSGGDLSDKTVLAYRGGYVDWNVPTHDALGPDQTGVYGLLPSLVADLAGHWALSAALANEDDELSQDELDGADVLLVIQPLRSWPEDRLKRVEEFVRRGGSLLVAAGPMVEAELDGRANAQTAPQATDETPALVHDVRPVSQLLGPTGMAVRHDVALSATEFWTGAISGSTHPAVFGLSDRTLGLSLRESSTIAMGWPARPILIGRWGWSQPGNDVLYNGHAAIETGQQWGDLVLAAERPLGRGTVVALADPWCLTNLGLADGHELASRLLVYLANRPSSPQSMWRQILALLGYAVLFVLIVRRTNVARLVAIVLTLSVVLAAATLFGRSQGPIPRPDGPSSVSSNENSGAPLRSAPATPNAAPDGPQADSATPAKDEGPSRVAPARPIAYVDTSHLEIGNDQPWANDGVDGFLMTLARNGYLPLKLHRWDPARLERAAVLVVMGPAKPFSAGELRDARDFVERGGHVFCMIGATEAAAGRGLLAEFGFDVRPSPSPTGSGRSEAQPMAQFPDDFGRFDTPYLNAADYDVGNYLLHVFFFTGWAVDSSADNAESLVFSKYDNRPLAMARTVGKGKIVVIGDSRFALNHNHGYYDGRMTQGVYDNAAFWRWLLTRITGQTEWIPPEPAPRSGQETSRDGRRTLR